MLFEASTVYAPGEPRGNVPYSQYQNMGVLGRYTGLLQQVSSAPNLVIGLAGLALVAYLVHRSGGRK